MPDLLTNKSGVHWSASTYQERFSRRRELSAGSDDPDASYAAADEACGTLAALVSAAARLGARSLFMRDEIAYPVPDPDEHVDDTVDEAEPIVPPPAVEPAAGPPTLPPNDPPSRGIVGP